MTVSDKHNTTKKFYCKGLSLFLEKYVKESRQRGNVENKLKQCVLGVSNTTRINQLPDSVHRWQHGYLICLATFI